MLIRISGLKAYFSLKFLLTQGSSTAVFDSVGCGFAEWAAALLVKGPEVFRCKIQLENSQISGPIHERPNLKFYSINIDAEV